MSRQSKIEQIRKESIQRLNEERLKKLHQEYRDAPFIGEAKDNVAPGAAAAGAAGGGGSGISGVEPWPGLFTKTWPKSDDSADENACEGVDGYNKHYYTESGLAFRGMEEGPHPEGSFEHTYTDPQLTNEVPNTSRIGWNSGSGDVFYFYEIGEFGEPRWIRKACTA